MLYYWIVFFLCLLLLQHQISHTFPLYYDEPFTIHLLKSTVTHLNKDPRHTYTMIGEEALGSGAFSKVYLAFETTAEVGLSTTIPNVRTHNQTQNVTILSNATKSPGISKVNHAAIKYYAVKVVKINNLKTIGYCINELRHHQTLLEVEKMALPYPPSDFSLDPTQGFLGDVPCNQCDLQGNPPGCATETCPDLPQCVTPESIRTTRLVESFYYEGFVYMIYEYVHGVTLSQVLSLMTLPDEAQRASLAESHVKVARRAAESDIKESRSESTFSSTGSSTLDALYKMPSGGIFYLLVSLLEFRQFLYSSTMNYLCHHDWDASNLMMNSKGQLVMIDFGLAVYYLSHPKEGSASQFHDRTEINNSTLHSYPSSIVDIRRRFMYTSDCSDPAKLVILLQKLTLYLPLKSRTCVSALIQNEPTLPKLLDTQPNLTCHLIRGIKRCFYQQVASEEENFLLNFPTKAPALVDAHGDSVSWPDIIVQVHPNLSQL